MSASNRTQADSRGSFLFGLTRAADARDAVTAAKPFDRSARAIVSGDLAALVGGSSSGDVRDRLLTHFDVLSAVAGVVDVLPVRFGVVVASDEQLHDVVTARSAAIEETLTRLRGCVEMRVRAQYREEEVLRRIALERPEVRRLREATRGRTATATAPERLQLGRLVVGALERRREQDRPKLLRSLLPIASDVRVSPPSLETEVLRASFLVTRKNAMRLRRTAEGAQVDGVPLLVRVTGPAPPWSFVDPGQSTIASGRRR